MDILRVIGTALMFAVLLFSISKKRNATMTLLLLGVGGLLLMMLLTGNSILGENTTGSFFIDLFEYCKEKFSSLLGGTVLILGSSLAFVSYVESISATKCFANTVSKPLKLIKSPYVVMGVALVLMAIIHIFITSAAACAGLFLATIYPILLATGLSKLSAAACVFFGAMYINTSPLSGMNNTLLSLGDTGTTIVEHFLTKELVAMPITLLIVIPVFCLVQSAIDKKLGTLADRQKATQSGEDEIPVDVPKYFAILPVIPLFLTFFFSKLVFKSITISVPAAMLVGFLIAFFCNLLHAKDKKVAFDGGQNFFEGLGRCVATTGSMLVCANIFCGAINEIGGISVIINLIMGNGGGDGAIVLVGALCTVLFFVSLAATGSANAHMVMFGTIFGQIASGPQLSKLIVMLNLGGSFGGAIAPVTGGLMAVVNYTGLDLKDILKRTMIPAIVGMVTAILVCAIAL